MVYVSRKRQSFTGITQNNMESVLENITMTTTNIRHDRRR